MDLSVLAIGTSSQGFAFNAEAVKGFGKNAKLYISYGEKDSVTFGKHMVAKSEFQSALWESETKAVPMPQKTQAHTLRNLKPNTKYFYRLRIENDEGKVWDLTTYSFRTK